MVVIVMMAVAAVVLGQSHLVFLCAGSGQAAVRAVMAWTAAMISAGSVRTS
ncbi:hypothetical protein X737_33570 [Mesorhizobium sp. L48C026A00]|nr:hypothetical protein X737_33570 [Mesorhizobium sp. L48C026A00]